MTEDRPEKEQEIMTIPIFYLFLQSLNVMAVKVESSAKILNWSNEINIEDMAFSGFFRFGEFSLPNGLPMDIFSQSTASIWPMLLPIPMVSAGSKESTLPAVGRMIGRFQHF